MSRTDAQSMLLAVLVRDLGYDHEPVYGHDPLRHQFAWMAAVDGMTSEDVAAEVAKIQEGARREGEVPLPERLRQLEAEIEADGWAHKVAMDRRDD